LRGIRTELAVRALMDWYVPIFAVVGNNSRDFRVRRIYQEGAAAVFAWPGEKTLFARLLAEILGIEQVRGEASRPDVALARAIRTRLKLLAGLGRGINIRVFECFARLSGELGSLWQKDRVQEITAGTPGVKGAFTDELRVAASGISDRSLEKSIRTVLKNTTSVDQSTLSLSAENGYVSVAGTFKDRRELNRVTEMICNVHGVRGIENLATISAKKKKKERRVVSRLQWQIEQLVPDNEIDVSVFGNVAVLRGRVGLLSKKREIERFVASDGSIDRIVSKLEVA
jgi:osmotically-inducible protein OsmY